jgi:hypothetical protein
LTNIKLFIKIIIKRRIYKMSMNKRYGLFTGIMLIIATVAGSIGMTFILPLSKEGAMQNITEYAASAKTGGLLVLVMGIACASIAVCIYPAIRKGRPALAMASVVFRAIEGAIFMASAMFLLPLGTLAQSASEASLLFVLFDSIGNAAAIAFCIGALMYYLAFWQLRVVPRWLSGWGLVAIGLHTVANVLVLGGAEAFGVVGVTMNLPIALQEMVMAVWLMVKGFSSGQITESAR